MNKAIIVSMISTALLYGCGSSSSGDSETIVPTIYQWDIVQLVSVEESSLDSTCIIYDDSTYTDGNVISAIVADDDYYILYHNSDGSVSDSYEASEYLNGLVTISSADIPDDGYMSVQEVSDGISSDSNVYMFSVQKSLMTDLVINVRSDQGSNVCYSGYDYRDVSEDISDVAVINVLQPSFNIAYYQTSYGSNYDSSSDLNSVSGHNYASKIPVLSPLPAEHDVLVLAFDTYDSSTEEKNDLSYYGFFGAGYVYEYDEANGIDEYDNSSGTDIPDAITTSFTWSSDITGLTLSDSTVYAIHSDVIYYWQLLSNSTDGISIGDTGDVTNWSAYNTGSDDSYGWNFTDFESFNAESTGISFDLPELGDVSSVSLSSSCAIDVDDDSENEDILYCLDMDSSYSEDDFSFQRTTFYAENDNGGTLYQSVYSKATDDPILLENEQFDTINTTTRIEISLISTDGEDEDAIKYLMAQNMDKAAMAEEEPSVILGNTFQDTNGYIATASELDDLGLAMYKTTTLFVENTN